MNLTNKCRACLSTDRRMYAINNTVIQDMWEKLTNAKFNSNDGKPVVVCYICCVQLRKSHQMMKRALKAEELLTDYINSDSEMSQQLILAAGSLANGLNYNVLKQYCIKHGEIECNAVGKLKQNIEKITKDCGGVYEESYKTVKRELNEDTCADIDEERNAKDCEEANIKQTVEYNAEDRGGTYAIYNEVNRDIKVENTENIKQTVEYNVEDCGGTYGIYNEVNRDIKEENTEYCEDINERDFEDANEENIYIYFKKEEPECSNSWQEENQDNDGIEPKTETGNDESPKNVTPKNLLDREVRIILEKIDIGTLRRKCKLNETPQNVKLLKLDEATNNWKPLSTAISKSLSNNNCKASDMSFSIRNPLERKVEIFESTQTPNSVNFCRVDSVSSKVCITQNDKVPPQNVIQNEIALTKVISDNNADNETIKTGELNIHLRKHTIDKPYICNLCDYRCSRKNSLKSHVQYKHIKEKNFSCHICQYKCVTKSNLSRHLQKHTDEKQYKCGLCDYRCSEKGYLKIHMQYKHTKEKNFSCHTCQYKCVTKSGLIIHLRKHTKEKPYICGLCDSKFTRTDSLKIHMQSKHTKEKNFSCHICQHKCVKKGDLIIHLRKHTKEKPYICDLCDYRCSQKCHLKTHMQYIHKKEKNFSCHICQYKCVSNNILRRHLQKHTKGTPPLARSKESCEGTVFNCLKTLNVDENEKLCI